VHKAFSKIVFSLAFLSLRATEGSEAISLISIFYEIASVVPLPRNDVVTQSPEGGKGGFFIEFVFPE
jgi:hypothetical protein